MTAIDLNTRYAAAWLEHNTRVEQRQNAIQLFLATAAGIFGFYFFGIPKHEDALAWFLLIGVSSVSFFTSLLLWMHHRVIQHLTTFLRQCELAAGNIAQEGKDGCHLFYWADPKDDDCVEPFHYKQRFLHRCVLACILLAPTFAAFYLAIPRLAQGGELSKWAGLGASIVFTGLTVAILFSNLNLDKNDTPKGLVKALSAGRFKSVRR
jgi:hypothetical protein